MASAMASLDTGRFATLQVTRSNCTSRRRAGRQLVLLAVYFTAVCQAARQLPCVYYDSLLRVSAAKLKRHCECLHLLSLLLSQISIVLVNTASKMDRDSLVYKGKEVFYGWSVDKEWFGIILGCCFGLCAAPSFVTFGTLCATRDL